MANRANAPNWKRIKAEYIRGGISQQKLADKYGVHRSTLQGRMQREGWQQLRDETQAKASQKLVEKTADAQAGFLAELSAMQARAAKAAYEKLVSSLENYPDGVGTRTVRETVEVKEITMEDGSVRKFPLRSCFTGDIESAVRSIATLGKLFGLDAGSDLDKQRYELHREQVRASQGDLTKQPENNLVEVLMESMRSVTEDAIPEIEPAPEPDGDVVDEG